MGEAIETTQTLYPSLLESRPNLLFMLKGRQFIEMVGGADSEVRSTGRSPKSQSQSPNYAGVYSGASAARSRSRSSSPGHSSAVQTSVIQSTKSFSMQQHVNGASGGGGSGSGGSSLLMTVSSADATETDGDVEMNGSGSVQNGSHSTLIDPEAESNAKDDGLSEMGTFSSLLIVAKKFGLMISLLTLLLWVIPRFVMLSCMFLYRFNFNNFSSSNDCNLNIFTSRCRCGRTERMPASTDVFGSTTNLQWQPGGYRTDAYIRSRLASAERPSAEAARQK